MTGLSPESDDLGVVPAPSIWPFLLSLGLTVAVTGLAFGVWLVLLGVGILAVSAVGWLAIIDQGPAGAASAGIAGHDQGQAATPSSPCPSDPRSPRSKAWMRSAGLWLGRG